jgi:hypothetical protein
MAKTRSLTGGGVAKKQIVCELTARIVIVVGKNRQINQPLTYLKCPDRRCFYFLRPHSKYTRIV